MKKILLAGATGYLGGYIAKELHNQNYFTRVIVRNLQKCKHKNIEANEIVETEITQGEIINKCCENIDVVISTVGITRQKDNLTYMDVDYQANMNLLQEAKARGVKKFIYISALNADNLKHLKICEAKEKFVNALQKSGLDYCIVRPHGFFSDMAEFYNMANNGRVYLFGDGKLKGNPIHGEDLAEVCVNAIKESINEIKVGGPEILSQNEIAEKAFKALGKKTKITYIPNWVRIVTLKMIRTFTGSKVYGPIEFFLTVIGLEMIAPQYGKHRLEEFFTQLNTKS